MAQLIQDAFVPFRFSMSFEGCSAFADDDARQLVTTLEEQQRFGNSQNAPPDLFVVSPDRELLGRLHFAATARQTLEFLQGVLQQHPSIVPADWQQQTVPAGRSQFEALEARWEKGERALVVELDDWVNRYGAANPTDAAVAKTMLGAALFHAGDFEGAHYEWDDVLQKYPGHPVQHRAQYNKLDPLAWPTRLHNDLVGAKLPTVKDFPAEVPDVARRNANLAELRANPQVRWVEGLPFVRIPGGTYTMGGTPAWFPRELPNRRVTLSQDFWMSAWPVTRALWAQFRPETWPGVEHEGLAGELPAAGVSFVDAEKFVAWFRETTGIAATLPTEAQWEYGARGGLEEAEYPWGNAQPDPSRCNYERPRPVPVGSYAPNGYGLFEMVGNIQEWCADHYIRNAYSLTEREVTDPTGPPPNEQFIERVVRGGFLAAPFCAQTSRNAWRLGYQQEFDGVAVGFRLVLPA